MFRYSALLFLLIGTFGMAKNAPVLQLNGGFEFCQLDGFLAQYSTSSSANVWRVYRQKQTLFQFTDPIPVFAANFDTHWIKIEIKPLKDFSLVLDYQQVFIDEVDFYAFTGGSLVAHQRSSWQQSFDQKPVPSRYHAFAFEAKAGRIYTLLVRCQNTKIRFSNRAFVRLATAKAFVKNNDTDLFALGLGSGCQVLMAFLPLAFVFFVRQRIYVHYGIYALSVVFYGLSMCGLLNQFFNPQTSFLASPRFYEGSLMLNFLSYLLYTIDFLKVKMLRLPWVMWFCYTLVILLSFQVFSVLLLPRVLVPNGIIYIAFALLVILLLVIAISQKQQAAYIYLLASGPMFVSFLIVFLGALKIIRINSFFFYYSNIPLTFEAVGLGLALLYKFNHEKNKIQVELEQNRLETTQKILLAQEEERANMAIDLHDDLGGTLSFLQREFDQINKKYQYQFDAIYGLIQKSVEDLRQISHHMMPSAFAQKGLKRAVEETIEVVKRQNKAQVSLICMGTERRLGYEKEMQLYRIIKELLANALKHAEAKQIVIQLIFQETLLYISVEDDGKGISPLTEPMGIGLKNVHLRSDYLGLKLLCETSPTGTVFAIDIPYEATQKLNSSHR